MLWRDVALPKRPLTLLKLLMMGERFPDPTACSLNTGVVRSAHHPRIHVFTLPTALWGDRVPSAQARGSPANMRALRQGGKSSFSASAPRSSKT